MLDIMKYFTLKEMKKSLVISIWFMILTFPIMVIKVNTIENTVVWRWASLLGMGIGSFIMATLWRYLLERKNMKSPLSTKKTLQMRVVEWANENPKVKPIALIAVSIFVLSFPFFSGLYQTSIMTTALMYVVLGLGLNIVVGLGGLLHLGYAAFYAVGAYTYALLNYHFGLSFWICLPIGAGLATIMGILLAIPVLRLRGDYLAIVTLGFGEVIRIVLENWNQFSFGPSGIAQIPRPGFFGMSMNLQTATTYIYFIMIAMVIFTIFVVRRLENSRIGRTWVAMREDEIASESMGIDITKSKITTFALGAFWAGMVGVVFAAKTTFINPASFTLWESVMILCVVVIGGMGSIVGVVVGAMILILMPEYLRAFSEYRMLIFGAMLVIMMVFRPGGIISNIRKKYKFEPAQAAKNADKEGVR
ncbi:MAG: branched-chain amino acid ABC transporter permease [Spirochaetia bacterium]|jgi:branched-chain amino acid transport system permease protein|nr:branched-chain amino acid ABC transporter permease [Spirochaetia bacterium]